MTLNALLKSIPLFQSLPPEALQQLAEELKTRALQAGEILFHLGEPGNEMIIVRRGKIAIYMPEEGNPGGGHALRIFKSGEILGEMALIDRLPRSTSARAETDAVIAALDFEAFQRLLQSHPEVSMDVMSGLSGRIRYTTNFIGEMRRWIQKMAEGKYQEIKAPEEVADGSLAALAADFVRMAAQVREREEKLQREVIQLRIEIDETKRRQEVARITGSEYYINLKEKLKALREENDEVVSPPGKVMRLIYEKIETPEEKADKP
ncbi:MAG: cyclic nucleotide-binding domain-containing protein [Chloroflexi bacterium]|nr:cyclic nucleotide-binding domain-containing protein [Chloroflexota bacterium]